MRKPSRWAPQRTENELSYNRSPRNHSPRNYEQSLRNRSPRHRSPRHRSPRNRSPRNRSPRQRSPRQRAYHKNDRKRSYRRSRSNSGDRKQHYRRYQDDSSSTGSVSPSPEVYAKAPKPPTSQPVPYHKIVIDEHRWSRHRLSMPAVQMETEENDSMVNPVRERFGNLDEMKNEKLKHMYLRWEKKVELLQEEKRYRKATNELMYAYYKHDLVSKELAHVVNKVECLEWAQKQSI